jgi:hypothetical protein
MSEPVNCTNSELSIFLRALEAGFLPIPCSDTSASAPLKSITIASKSWQQGKKTVVFPGFRFSMTFAGSTETHGAGLSMLWQEDFLARTSQSAAAETDLTANEAAYGWKWPGSFVRYSRETSSWKTRQCSLVEGLDEFSGTWPQWGSMHDGECSAHTTPAWVTCGNVSGLWPTPTASDDKGSVLPETARKRAARSSRGVRLPEYLTLKGLLPGGRHNPEFSEWLMGWPLQWSDTAPLGTDRFQLWLQQHGAY